MPRPRIDFFYFNAGGGHRAAATALDAVIREQQRDWDVRLVNLNEILLATDMFKKFTGLGLEDIYNLMLQKGWTLGSTQLLPVMQFFIRMFHKQQVRLIRNYWQGNAPDLAVSVVPNFNRAIFDGLRAAGSAAPYVTILTDLADYPPHFWMEHQDQYVVCGSAKAEQQARDTGYAPDRVFRVSGMILRPSFYETKPVNRGLERERLGLHAETPTGLVLFGGHGAPVMEKIARRLQEVRQPLQLILLCGHNEKLAARLRAMTPKIPMRVEGFTSEVPRLMQISDFMIGKPGPGSVSEAMAMRLPVIVERNAWTLPQERYNADWIVENGVGLVLDHFGGIRAAVERLLEPGQLEQYRSRTEGIENRAVFEIVEILERLLGRG